MPTLYKLHCVDDGEPSPQEFMTHIYHLWSRMRFNMHQAFSTLLQTLLTVTATLVL